MEQDFDAIGVEVVYFPYTLSTSSSALRKTLANIDILAGDRPPQIDAIEVAHTA